MNDEMQSRSGGSDACCGAPAADKPRGARVWRTIVFSLIILAAVAVTTYSFLNGGAATANRADDAPVVASFATGEDAGESDALLAASAEHDVLFAFMPGGGEQDAAAHEVMMATVGYLNSGGAKAGTLELERGSEQFAAAASRYAPESYPAVLAVSRQGEVQAVCGEISQTTLLKACVRACGMTSGGKAAGCKSACGSAKKKGCDPAACGM